MTNPVDRNRYEGFAVGGPYKGAKMMRVGDPVWQVARMVPIPLATGMHINDQPFIEKGRGRYEWDAGVWWWKGWE